MKIVIVLSAVLCLVATKASVRNKRQLAGFFFDVNGRNYYCSDILSLTFDEATEWCHYDNMVLASLETHTENTQVTQFLNSVGYTMSWPMWLSGRGSNTEFVWTGNGASFTYTDWSGRAPEIRGTEPCVYMDPSDHWHGASCSESHAFLCEQM